MGHLASRSPSTPPPAGQTFDWTSNIGVDAVFVKGGPVGGNLYVYDPEATADTGLHAPAKPVRQLGWPEPHLVLLRQGRDDDQAADPVGDAVEDSD